MLNLNDSVSILKLEYMSLKIPIGRDVAHEGRQTTQNDFIKSEACYYVLLGLLILLSSESLRKSSQNVLPCILQQYPCYLKLAKVISM